VLIGHFDESERHVERRLFAVDPTPNNCACPNAAAGTISKERRKIRGGNMRGGGFEPGDSRRNLKDFQQPDRQEPPSTPINCVRRTSHSHRFARGRPSMLGTVRTSQTAERPHRIGEIPLVQSYGMSLSHDAPNVASVRSRLSGVRN
jgi:hypothetical protein